MLGLKKRIKALEGRVEELENQIKYLSFAFKEQSESADADAKENGKELSTKELLDEWLNGGKNDAK